MERVRNQAKEMFPNIHLTLISIIQALALEVLWSAVNAREHLWAWNAAALTGWLQAAAVFELLFFLWLVYTQMVMRIRWVVTMRDSLIPFILGIGQFTLANLIHPEKLHLWFYVLAALGAFGVWVNVITEREAQAEPDNQELLAALGRSRLLPALTPLVACVLMSLGAGGLVQWHGAPGGLSAALVAFVNLAVLGLIGLNVIAWKRSIA
jgi:hypothetical protein